MKNNLRFLALLVCAIMICSMNAVGMFVPVFSEQLQREKKVYSKATMEHEFADNRVLVILNNEASLNYLRKNTSERCDHL